MREGSVAVLRELVTSASERRVGPGAERVLPVAVELREALPWPGLRRGAVISAGPGPGGLSLLLAAAARATIEGAWCGVIGVPDLGVLAAAELDVQLGRLVLVPDPGPEPLRVLGQLAEGVEVLLAGGPWLARVTPMQAQRITARLRQRGAVLLVRGPWPGADVTWRTRVVGVDGLGQGHGRIRGRRLMVEAVGRSLGRARRLELMLPTAGGGLSAVAAVASAPGAAPPATASKGTPPAVRLVAG